MIIQFILVLLLVAVIIYFLQNRNAMKLRAGKKLLFLVFVIFALATIIRPSMLTEAAHKVGVGRGADLLLYGLVFAFVFVTINIYMKFKDYEQRLNRLARSIAIDETALRNRKK